jgi:signal transduction histidine kinase
LRNFSADADVERRSRYLEIVENQLTQLSTMVEHILSVSVEGRKYRFNPAPVEIGSIISQLASSVEMNNGKKAEFRISCPEGTAITADEFHIRNLLATLIDNAVKYSENPVVQIYILEEPDRLSIIIKDNGRGISKEHLPHVFEKFYRVPTGDIHSVRGYGLGLYYAKQVTELHRGTISIESQPGKGTTVTVILPKDER